MPYPLLLEISPSSPNGAESISGTIAAIRCGARAIEVRADRLHGFWQPTALSCDRSRGGRPADRDAGRAGDGVLFATHGTFRSWIDACSHPRGAQRAHPGVGDRRGDGRGGPTPSPCCFAKRRAGDRKRLEMIASDLDRRRRRGASRRLSGCRGRRHSHELYPYFRSEAPASAHRQPSQSDQFAQHDLVGRPWRRKSDRRSLRHRALPQRPALFRCSSSRKGAGAARRSLEPGAVLMIGHSELLRGKRAAFPAVPGSEGRSRDSLRREVRSCRSRLRRRTACRPRREPAGDSARCRWSSTVVRVRTGATLLRASPRIECERGADDAAEPPGTRHWVARRTLGLGARTTLRQRGCAQPSPHRSEMVVAGRPHGPRRTAWRAFESDGTVDAAIRFSGSSRLRPSLPGTAGNAARFPPAAAPSGRSQHRPQVPGLPASRAQRLGAKELHRNRAGRLRQSTMSKAATIASCGARDRPTRSCCAN